MVPTLSTPWAKKVRAPLVRWIAYDENITGEETPLNRYVIILRDDSTIQDDAISKAFDHSVVIGNRVWAVASTDLTCWDICEKIGLSNVTAESPVPTGIVLKIDEINGYTYSNVWDKLRVWAEL